MSARRVVERGTDVIKLCHGDVAQKFERQMYAAGRYPADRVRRGTLLEAGLNVGECVEHGVWEFDGNEETPFI